MNLGQLIAAFREEADDEVAPFLWKNSTLFRFANQAQEEAARRARILLDATTPKVCTYSVNAGDPWIKLDSSVIHISHALIQYKSADTPPVVTNCNLTREHKRDLDMYRYDWRQDCGEPRHFITDMESGKIRFDKIPDCPGTLQLEVARMPLVDVCDAKQCFEIPDRYVPDLVYWLLWRAYSKQDAETYDQKRAEKNLALFEQVFGSRSSAIDEQWHGNLPNTRRSVTRFQ